MKQRSLRHRDSNAAAMPPAKDERFGLSQRERGRPRTQIVDLPWSTIRGTRSRTGSHSGSQTHQLTLHFDVRRQTSGCLPEREGHLGVPLRTPVRDLRTRRSTGHSGVRDSRLRREAHDEAWQCGSACTTQGDFPPSSSPAQSGSSELDLQTGHYCAPSLPARAASARPYDSNSDPASRKVPCIRPVGSGQRSIRPQTAVGANREPRPVSDAVSFATVHRRSVPRDTGGFAAVRLTTDRIANLDPRPRKSV
jgi:hypothetical protein